MRRLRASREAKDRAGAKGLVAWWRHSGGYGISSISRVDEIALDGRRREREQSSGERRVGRGAAHVGMVGRVTVSGRPPRLHVGTFQHSNSVCSRQHDVAESGR